MITQLNKNSLYSTFGVDNFTALEGAINTMAPSMVEYYISDLCDYSNINSMEDGFYFNKKNIENMIEIGELSLYIDYNEEIFLEINLNTIEEYETASLW